MRLQQSKVRLRFSISRQTVIQRGVGRGVFSNEAGLGSAPIAAAAAKTKSPEARTYFNDRNIY